MKKSILASALWIVTSEFIRNELLFKNYWVDHYKSLNLSFSTSAINGVFWMIWSFVFAFVIAKITSKYSFWETFIISWLLGFVMMWLVLYNLQVLPLFLLLPAIPLSLLEVFVAIKIIKYFE